MSTSLYLDPGHLKPFQTADAEKAIELGAAVLGWDTGMGKSRGLLALAARLMDRGEIDVLLLVCEQNKLSEWEPDIAKFTAATARRHHGPGRLESLHELPHILLTTYETAREDLVVRDGDKLSDGPLMAALAGRRVAVAYDEMPKLAQHSSGLYQAHEYLINRLPWIRVYGLTATPYTRDWDSVYNLFRLVCPHVLPSRDTFETECVLRRKARGRTLFNERAVRSLVVDPIQPYLLRRRKTDPEVRDLFPVMREKALHAPVQGAQARLYGMLHDFGAQAWEAGQDSDGLWNVLRLVAAYPEALLGANGKLATDLVEAMGEQMLRSMRPSKLDPLLHLARHAVAQGRKTVIFSFFGPTVLPLLARDLEPLGVPVLTYRGGMGAAGIRAIREFRGHDGPALLLSSDAGSRGINLPEADRLIEYECALTYETGAQRRNRIHRMDSPHREVVCATLIADGTVEQPIAAKMLRRNEDTDMLLGDDIAQPGFTPADMRRAMMQVWGPQPVAAAA